MIPLTRKLYLRVLLFLCFSVAVFGGLQRADAATIVVSTTTDEINVNGNCSLREAVINANHNSQAGSLDCTAGSGQDQIILQKGLYALSLFGAGADHQAYSGDLDLTDSAGIEIVGQGSGLTSVDGAGYEAVFESHAGRLSLYDLSIQNGMPSGVTAYTDLLFSSVELDNNAGHGLAVYPQGSTLEVNLEHSQFTNNAESGFYASGAGTLELFIHDSIFSNNSRDGAQIEQLTSLDFEFHDGVFMSNGHNGLSIMQVSNNFSRGETSVFEFNENGLYDAYNDGNTILFDSDFTDNSRNGIYVIGDSSVLNAIFIYDTLFTQNTVGLAIEDTDDSTVIGSHFSDNVQGINAVDTFLNILNSTLETSGEYALLLSDTFAEMESSNVVDNAGHHSLYASGISLIDHSYLVFERSLLYNNMSYNSAFNGRMDGIYVESGSSLISNTSTFSGNASSAINNDGSTLLLNSTVSGNDLYNDTGGHFEFQSTILDTTCFGSFSTLGHNIEPGNTCGLSLSALLQDQRNTNPKLIALKNNGGPTRTHALNSTSPAIDRGDCAFSQDQRWMDRYVDGDRDRLLECDIGAYEWIPTVYGPNSQGKPSETGRESSFPFNFR